METGSKELYAILSALRDGEELAGRMMCQSGDEAIRPSEFFFFKERGGKKERLSIPNYIRAYGAEGLFEVIRTLIKGRPNTIEFMAAIFAEVADTYMSNTITPNMPEHEELFQQWLGKKRPDSFIDSNGHDYKVIMAGGKPLFINKGAHSPTNGVSKHYESSITPATPPKVVASDANPAPRKRVTKSKTEEADGEEGSLSSNE